MVNGSYNFCLVLLLFNVKYMHKATSPKNILFIYFRDRIIGTWDEVTFSVNGVTCAIKSIKFFLIEVCSFIR